VVLGTSCDSPYEIQNRLKEEGVENYNEQAQEELRACIENDLNTAAAGGYELHSYIPGNSASAIYQREK